LLQRKSRQVANLRQEEVIAIVLCTGPMFQIYNTSLRRYPKEDFELFEKRDNLFCTTVFALVSAVQKLSRFTRIPSWLLKHRPSTLAPTSEFSQHPGTGKSSSFICRAAFFSKRSKEMGVFK
jgi:hypothetical protein